VGFWDELEDVSTRWAEVVLDLSFFRAQDPLGGIAPGLGTTPGAKRQVLRYLQRTNVLTNSMLAIVQARELARWMTENAEWVQRGCWDPRVSNRKQWAEEAGVISSFLAPEPVQYLLTPPNPELSDRTCKMPTVALFADLESPYFYDAREGFYALVTADAGWFDDMKGRERGTTKDPEGRFVFRVIRGATENIGQPTNPYETVTYNARAAEWSRRWRLRFRLAEAITWPQWHQGQLEQALRGMMRLPIQQGLQQFLEMMELYDEANNFKHSTGEELWRSFVEDTTPPASSPVEPWTKRLPVFGDAGNINGVGLVAARLAVDNRPQLPTRI